MQAPMQRDVRTSIGNLVHQNSAPQPPYGPVITKFDLAGRGFYSADGVVEYPLPVDELEANRLDMQHFLVHKHALGGQLLYMAELPKAPRKLRILDVGCGTGIWAQEMSAKYPNAFVTGIDLYLQRPPFDPDWPRVKFLSVNFLDSNWPFQEGEFDLIHLGGLNGSVPDWDSLLRKCFRYLGPGGMVQYIDFDWCPQFKPGHEPLACDKTIKVWWKDLDNASTQFGKPIAYPEHFRDVLINAGFVNPRHKPIDIDLSVFARETNAVKRWLRELLFSLDGLRAPTVEGLALYSVTTQLHHDPELVRSLAHNVAKDCWPCKSGLYFWLHVWTAIKP